MIWALCAVVFGTWLLGVVFKLADGAFHILAVIAGILGAVGVVGTIAKKQGGSATE